MRRLQWHRLVIAVALMLCSQMAVASAVWVARALAVVFLGLAAGCVRSAAPDSTPVHSGGGWNEQPSPCGTRLYDEDGGFIVQSCPDLDAARHVALRDLAAELDLLGDDDAAPPPASENEEPQR
jgi:hypothetical protein